MHQNIKNNYTRSIDAKLYNEKYYDYMLYMGEVSNQSNLDLSNLAIADFSTLQIENGILYSTVTWSGATNSGVEMNDIGMTGVDNGFIKFQKDRISNEEFLNLYFNSKYEIESGDTRLFLTPVTGNTGRYSYPMFLIDDDDEKYIAFRGGFYQGFFKLDGFDYQVLPNSLGDETFLHFDIRPRSDVDTDVDTVNFIHPENAGIFFFMGTRAEDKFWPFYKYNEGDFSGFTRIDAQSEGYFDGCGEESGETYNINQNNVVLLEGDWLSEEAPEAEESYFAVGDGYYVYNTEECNSKSIKKNSSTFVSTKEAVFGKNYLNTYDYNPEAPCGCSSSDPSSPCNKKKNSYNECEKCCTEYFGDDYYNDKCPDVDNGKSIDENAISHGVAISENGDGYEDSFGHDINKNGYYEIESDNKFLMFDRTKDGFTTHNWVEGTTVTLVGRKAWPNANYFLLMNRTPTGYTARDIESYNEENGYDYNVYKDIRNNVFALRVTENGAIGYRLGVLDCSDDNENRYKVTEEYSKDGIINFDKWNSVNVRFVSFSPQNACGGNNGLMRIMIYVNGFLVFISKEIPSIVFKRLDESSEKQEAVPYNISLGGGSIGLLETILPNYYAISDYILPIERDFCGTFLGDIKSFKMYKGFVNYSAISNYLS